MGGVEGALVERWIRRRRIRVWIRAGAIVVGWMRLVGASWWSLRCAIYCDRIFRIVNRDTAVSALSLVTVYAQMRKRHGGKRTEECGSEPGHGGKRFHRVRVSKVAKERENNERYVQVV